MTNLYHVGYYRVTDVVNGGTLGVGYFVSELLPRDGRLVFSPITDKSDAQPELERLRARVAALESAVVDISGIGGSQDSRSALRAVQLIADLKRQLSEANTQIERLRAERDERTQACIHALGYRPDDTPDTITQAPDPLLMACVVFRQASLKPTKPKRAT